MMNTENGFLPIKQSGGMTLISSKHLTKRKAKKVQSAKVPGFKALKKDKKENLEWMRVLTPPRTETSSVCDPDIDADDEEEDDELIRRYFSGLSSAGSSISWAEDAMETQFTNQLLKLWDEIESVCKGGSRPEKMSDVVHEECLQWKRAFPNPDLHRFLSSRNDADVSPVESPTFDYEIGDGDAAFSSLVHVARQDRGRKGIVCDDPMNLLQTNFRALNCATPRPNVEKSTQYVTAWLSECQNSYVPEGDHRGSAFKSRSSTPQLPVLDTSTSKVDPGEAPRQSKSGRSFRSDVAKSSYAQRSRSHAKFVAEPDPENFFTALAITSHTDSYQRFPKLDAMSNFGESQVNGGFTRQQHQNRIQESDEDEDDEESSANDFREIVSFRSNVRVQRPISSLMRDHTITPLATRPYIQPSVTITGRNPGTNLNRDGTVPNPISNTSPNAQRAENFWSGRTGLPDTNTNTASDIRSNGFRIQSGLATKHKSPFIVSRGRPPQQQAPWSRHSGDDLAAESGYVSSLYENYQGLDTTSNLIGSRNSLRSIHNELIKSPDSAKSRRIGYNEASDPPNNIQIDNNISYSKPIVSWLANRISPH